MMITSGVTYCYKKQESGVYFLTDDNTNRYSCLGKGPNGHIIRMGFRATSFCTNFICKHMHPFSFSVLLSLFRVCIRCLSIEFICSVSLFFFLSNSFSNLLVYRLLFII